MSKTQIITCAVIKGGTGKTTTCAAIAQAAALDDKKVLAIDLDPQANFSFCLGADKTLPGAYELLNGAFILDCIQQTEQNIDVIAGAPALAADNPGKKKNTIFRLSEALEKVKGFYDLIVIDTPPYFCELTFEALQASTGVLIPMEADAGSIHGQKHIIEVAKEIKRTNKKLKILGCIITRYNARPVIARKMRDLIIEQGQELKCPLLAEIRQGIAIQEAQALNKSIYDYAPKSKPAQDYKELYNKLFK